MARRQIPERIRKEAADWLARNESDWAGEDPGLFEAWLARDLRHRLAYAEADRAWRDSLLLEGTPMGRTRQLSKAPLYMRRSTHVAALSLTVLLGVGLLTVRFTGLHPAVGIGTVVEAQTYRTVPGETRTWSLPDGSTLTLSGEGLVRARFDRKIRRIDVERGIARIRVSPTEERQLEIHAADLSVVARDAAVEVTATPAVRKITVLAGQVEAMSRDGATRPLGASESITLPPVPAAKPTPLSEASHRTSATLLGVNGMTVGQAVENLNRENALQIRFENESMAAQRLTGAFRIDDPVTFANALAVLEDLEIVRKPGTITLRPR